MGPDDVPWNRCHFCGRDSQERVRTCCELGGVADRKYLEPERVAEWEKAALEWLPDGSRHFPGDYLENAGEALADVAGRLITVIDELGRLRSIRDLAKHYGHVSSRVQRALEVLSESTFGARWQQVELARGVLSDDSWYYIDRKRFCTRCGTCKCDRQGGTLECGKDALREAFSQVPVEVIQTTVFPPRARGRRFVMELREAEVDDVLSQSYRDSTPFGWKLLQEEVKRLRAELAAETGKADQHLASLCAVCDELAEPGDESRLRERLTEMLTTDPDEPRDEWVLSSMQKRMLALDVVGQKALRIIERHNRRKVDGE